jgi:hypothetical protein
MKVSDSGNTRGVQQVAGRIYRPLAVGLTLVFLGWAVVVAASLASAVQYFDGVPIAVDFNLYVSLAQGFVRGESFYPSWQLSGPYPIRMGASLYPPTLLYLMVPFIILPAVLWWAIPLSLIAYVVWHHRPAPWAWPLLALMVAWPRTQEIVVFGNPSMWAAAAVAAGTVWAWPAVLAAVKPTLAPFALIGLRRRSGWIALGVLVVVSLPFGAMWLDYAKVLTDLRGVGWIYSAWDAPILLIGVVAWAGSTQPVVAHQRQRLHHALQGMASGPGRRRPSREQM